MQAAKFKIGEIVKHINGKWYANVKAVKYDYAYGLMKRSKNKLYLYTLEDKELGELLGLWGEPELIAPCFDCQKMAASNLTGSLKACDITKKCTLTS